MGLVIRKRPDVCSVESARFCRPNVVSCEVVSGRQRTPLIRAYLPLSTLEHLTDLGGGIDLITREGYNCRQRIEHGHQTPAEPVEPTCSRIPGVLRPV